MCSPNPEHCGGTGGCEGSTAEIAFDYATKSKGIFQSFNYPYRSYSGKDELCIAEMLTEAPVASIDGYKKLPENDYLALMNAIATVGPIAISVDASTFHSYQSGIYNGCNQTNPDINHAVVLVGYGEEKGQKYWLVRNSWSPSYGEDGYIRIARSDEDSDKCGMDITPEHGTACAGHEEHVKACGTCGILFDSAYPLNAKSHK